MKHVDEHTSRTPVVAAVRPGRGVHATVVGMAGAAGAAKRSNVSMLWR